MTNPLALLALLAFQQTPATPPPIDWAQLMQRFQADAAALQKSGVALDLAAIKVEKLGPGELAGELAKREGAFFGSGWYELIWMTAQALGLKVDATADAFQVTFQRTTIGALPAWYVPARKAIVIDESQYSPDLRFDRVVMHALALASLDQQPGGLAALRIGTSCDELLCDRAWIEGRAELLGKRALGVPARPSLSAFEERTGGFALVDLAGSAEAARQELLPEAQRARPKSGSALLHGRTPPAAAIDLSTIALPGTQLLREDSLGELGLRFALSMAGAHPVRSIEASIGLASDRIRLWKYGDRDREFVWRLVFERESDAAEFEQLVAKIARGTRVRRGQVLDWSFATRAERESDLAKALAALPVPPPAGEADTRAVEELQRTRLARHPHVEGERWLLPEFDLAWKLPAGWKPSYYQAEAIVFIGAPDTGFRDNLTFHEYALPADATPEKVLEASRASFEKLAGTKLVRAELATTPAGPGVWIEFTQETQGRTLHQLELQLVRPGGKQAVTATALESHWKTAGPGIEALLSATERIAKPAAPGTQK